MPGFRALCPAHDSMGKKGYKMKMDCVWIRSSGCVVGVNLDWLNEKIDEYNRSPFLRSTGDFWGWLSWEDGEDYRGLDVLWNADTSKVHKIKGV